MANCPILISRFELAGTEMYEKKGNVRVIDEIGTKVPCHEIALVHKQISK